MRKPLILAALILAVPALAGAQAPAASAPAPPPPRARGPALDPAIEMARQAVATCTANGYKTTALVTDSAGVPVVLLSGDGAAQRTQMVAGTKVAASLKYKMDGGEISAKAKADPAFTKALMDDPAIGGVRQGALLIKVGGEIIGAIAVSGAPGGDKDEVCSKAGLDKVAARLK